MESLDDTKDDISIVMEPMDDTKNDSTDNNDVISSYFKDIKNIMDLHGRMVSAVDDTVNRLPFGDSINISLATTIAANSQRIGKKHKKSSKTSQAQKDSTDAKEDELTILVQKKDEIIDEMNKQIAALQKIKDEHKRENILKDLTNKLSIIDDMNEEILQLKDVKNHSKAETGDEFNDENEINFDDMHIGMEHSNVVDEKEDTQNKTLTFHFVGFGTNNINSYECMRIMEKVSGITVDTTLTSQSTIEELRQLIYKIFAVPIVNNKRDRNDLLILYSHLVLNDDFLDEQTLSDAGIIDNSFFLIAIKDKEEEEIHSIFDITSDDIELINQMMDIKQRKEENNSEMDIGQILQRLKIEKKLSLDIITLETDVEVFKMPDCGHSMTASSLYDYALSQCLNKKRILTCAHFKCTAQWQYPIIKHYLLTTIKDDIIASVLLEKEREERREENALKDQWEIGSFCLIFSRSQNAWQTGQISDITNENNDEWLIVKYGNNFKKKKRIQRYCKDLKPVSNEHPSNFIIGSKCQIFDSDTRKTWVDGTVVDIFHDNEGEWLQIKYSDNHKNKVCDIQRFSKDLKLVITASETEKKAEIKKGKKYDINYISKIKCGKLEILLSRNVLYRNQKYSVQKCINCNVLLYRVKNNKLGKIRFDAKCRMCEAEFCWSCNKEWKSNHSCDASFRFQVIEILAKCESKTIGSQENVPSVRSCPQCSALIYHVEACKHMDCGECHQSFCFVCLQSKDENDEWQCGSYSEHCPLGVYARQTHKDLPPMTYTKKFQLF